MGFLRGSSFLFLILSLFVAQAGATDRTSEVQILLDRYSEDPELFWNVNSSEEPKPRAWPGLFELDSLSEPRRNDRPQDLVDELSLTTLQAISEQKLEVASLEQAPWSDSYWPIYSGLIAQRFADPKYPGVIDWKANSEYLLGQLGMGSAEILSPAEKYDLLVGDPKFTMTHAMIDEGRGYFESTGKVETWMGICHGWAPASYMMPRAEHSITVLAADGKTKIPFYPSDIKALASLLWANGMSPTRFIGGRCNTRQPPEEPSGRPTSPDCLDSNPGTFHISIVNQIGHSHRSLIMDASYDFEVWNQPIHGYEYSYFNPKTKKTVESLQEATVPLSEFSEDRYKAFRSSRAHAVVGISMDVTYVSETEPSHQTTDSEVQDHRALARYLYDLEIDSQGNIVGGEWYSRAHPDFLWTPVRGSQVRTLGDEGLDHSGDRSVWKEGEVVPESWREAAREGAAYSQPLRRIVESLIRFSRIDSH